MLLMADVTNPPAGAEVTPPTSTVDSECWPGPAAPPLLLLLPLPLGVPAAAALAASIASATDAFITAAAAIIFSAGVLDLPAPGLPGPGDAPGAAAGPPVAPPAVPGAGAAEAGEGAPF